MGVLTLALSFAPLGVPSGSASAAEEIEPEGICKQVDPGDRPCELAGLNTITGPDTGTVLVHVPTEAELTWQLMPMGAHEAMTASGDGRATGFALVPVPNSSPDGKFVIRNRLSWCDQPGCTVQGDPMQCSCDWIEGGRTGFTDRTFIWPDNTYDFRVVLPAGDYLLYLVADGSPATVSFALYQPFSGTPLDGEAEIEVEPSPAAVSIAAAVNSGPGYWESGRNIASGQTQSFWFAAAWEHGVNSFAQPAVWGPAWLCDYPGGRTSTSAPCPATTDHWLQRGQVHWRASGPQGWTVAVTADRVQANDTHGIYFASLVPFSSAPLARGFLTIQIV